MPDYSKGKIYRIVCNETGEQYIGSTTQTLTQRLSVHVTETKNNYSKKCKSSQIIHRGNYAIVLIEEYPCENKNQLERRERYFIEKLDCINMNKPAQTKEELCEYHREYRTNNLEKLLEKSREYYDNNKEKMREKHNEYYDNNKEKIREKHNEY